jgi:hypothetical protein
MLVEDCGNMATWGCVMQFGMLGSIVQIEPYSEGWVLWRAGLLERDGEPWAVEIRSTPRLRAMFTAMPELEAVYPVLVEYVMSFRYRDNPGFVDANKVERLLTAMGMTRDGLASLHVAVADADGRAW